MYSLIFIPCVATQPDVTLLMGISDEFSNTLEFSFRARLNEDSGEFIWNGKPSQLAYCAVMHVQLLSMQEW